MSTFPIGPSEHRQKAIELMERLRAIAGEIAGFAHAAKGRRVKTPAAGAAFPGEVRRTSGGRNSARIE